MSDAKELVGRFEPAAEKACKSSGYMDAKRYKLEAAVGSTVRGTRAFIGSGPLLEQFGTAVQVAHLSDDDYIAICLGDFPGVSGAPSTVEAISPKSEDLELVIGRW